MKEKRRFLKICSKCFRENLTWAGELSADGFSAKLIGVASVARPFFTIRPVIVVDRSAVLFGAANDSPHCPVPPILP